MERWKTIKQAPRYRISDLGKIMSDISAAPKRSFMDAKGYQRVQLYREDGIAITCKVHRLVAQHFIRNPQHKPQVNHIDGNKSNNVHTNLEWMTNAENMAHAVKNGLQLSRPDIYQLGPEIKRAAAMGYFMEDIAKLQGTSTKTIRSAGRSAQSVAPELQRLKVGRRNYRVYFDESRSKWRTELRSLHLPNRQFESRDEAIRYVDLVIGKHLDITGPLAVTTDEDQRS